MINYVHDTNWIYDSRVHLLISCRSDLPAENITFPCVPPRHFIPSTSTAPGGFLWESFSASLCIKPLRYSCVPQVFMNSSVGVGFRPPIGASPSWWAHLLCCTTHKPNSEISRLTSGFWQRYDLCHSIVPRQRQGMQITGHPEYR